MQQRLVPGQSVSTLASEVFPKLESQLHQQQNQFESHQKFAAIDPRNRVSETEAQTPPPKKVTTKVVAKTTPEPTKAPKASSKPQFELPDEVPDDLRAQLLSSGILDNADISILDYDKVGDIPIESLPAEHLANFYGGGEFIKTI